MLLLTVGNEEILSAKDNTATNISDSAAQVETQTHNESEGGIQTADSNVQVDTLVSEDKQVSAHLIYDDDDDDEDSVKVHA